MREIMFLLIVFYSLNSFASFDGALINLDKFEDESKSMLSLKNIDTSGRSFFQDGAFSTDLQPLFDGASLFYISNETFTVNSKPLSFAYQLKLIDGSRNLVLIDVGNGHRRVDLLKGLIVTLKEDSSIEQTRKTVSYLKNKFPATIIEAYEFLGIINIKWESFNKQTVADAVSFIYEELNPQNVSMDYELYRLQISFGEKTFFPFERIVDLDLKRDVVKPFLNEGLAFTTEQSFIPSHLK